MELRHLRYFVAAAEEQHFGRASESLHVTRPAVSRVIADLESGLNILLLERKSHRVALTAVGRKLFVDVKAVMSLLNEALLAAKKIGESYRLKDQRKEGTHRAMGSCCLHTRKYNAYTPCRSCPTKLYIPTHGR